MLINASYSSRQKQAFYYVIKNRAGYADELKQFGDDVVQSMQSGGMINSGTTLNAPTYGTTKLCDSYFKDVYGNMKYVYLRIKGFIQRIERI